MNDQLIPNAPTQPMQEVESTLRVAASVLIEQANDTVIMTAADVSAATDVLKAIKTRSNIIEDERTKITKPINEGVKQINARFKAIADPLLQAETVLKNKILKFQREEYNRQEAERQRQEEAARQRLAAMPKVEVPLDRGGHQAPEIIPHEPPPVAEQPRTVYGQSGATSTVKKVWACEVTDVVELAKHNKEWVTPDMPKLNKAIQAGVRDIPGVRVFQKEILQVK